MEANIVEMVTLVVKGEMISLTLWGTAMQRHLSSVMKAVMKLLILGKGVLNIVTLFFGAMSGLSVIVSCSYFIDRQAVS